MPKSIIRVQYFFDNPEEFPWNIIDLSYPLYGPPHCYMLRAFKNMYGSKLVGYSSLDMAVFSRIEKLASEDMVLNKLVRHCEMYEEGEFSTKNAAVVAYLSNFDEFKDYLEQKLLRYYTQGLIELPEGATYGSKR